MRNFRRCLVSLVLAAVSAVALAAAERVTIVACAPGYPGSTEQAQPTMDEFASQTARAAGWSAEEIGAVYYKDLDSGLARLEEPDAALALVPLPFYLDYAESMKLRPLLQAVDAERDEETWTLVAGKGKLTGPTSLDGWEITGRGGYSPTFVRVVALDGWGPVPETADVTFTERAISALRKASRGDPVAVLLDGEQSAALEGLPFHAELERVFTSKPVPGSLLCVVDDRIGDDRADEVARAILSLADNKKGREILEELRLARFERVDETGLARVQGLWEETVGP